MRRPTEQEISDAAQTLCAALLIDVQNDAVRMVSVDFEGYVTVEQLIIGIGRTPILNDDGKTVKTTSVTRQALERFTFQDPNPYAKEKK